MAKFIDAIYEINRALSDNEDDDFYDDRHNDDNGEDNKASSQPSEKLTYNPIMSSTLHPSFSPTSYPSSLPSNEPSSIPSESPTVSNMNFNQPTLTPNTESSFTPSSYPSTLTSRIGRSVGECTVDNFPFSFLASNDTKVSGIMDNNICVFPDTYRNFSNGLRCFAKDNFVESGNNYMFVAILLLFVPTIFGRKFLKQIYKDGNQFVQSTIDRLNSKEKAPWWLGKLAFFQCIFRQGIYISIVVSVYISILMRQSIQEKLNVMNRNILMSASVFLVPYMRIFQLTEDIIAIRVSYALCRGNGQLADQLVHAGITLSLLTGTFAAVLATVLGLIPPVLRKFTNPGLDNNLNLYPGCDIIEGGEDNGASVLRFWLVRIWMYPGAQIAMIIGSYMMCALEHMSGWISVISLSVTPIIWYIGIGSTTNNPLILLSWSYFAREYIFLLLAILYMVSPLGSTLRKNTGVSLSFSKLYGSLRLTSIPEAKSTSVKEDTCLVTNEEEVVDDGKEEISMRDIIKDGCKIMVMDVVIQLTRSLTIYLSLIYDGATSYQLNALDSFMPSYGTAYALGIAQIFKIIGPTFVELKEHAYFTKIVRITIMCGGILVPMILATSVPFSSGLAFSSGANACEYLTSYECAPFFTSVFGPNAAGSVNSLQSTFKLFAFVSSVESLFLLLRTILLTFMDLDYMVWSTGIALIIYIPSIVVTTQVQSFSNQANAFFVAMNVPILVLVILFYIRLEVLIRRTNRKWSSARGIDSCDA